MTTYTKQRVTIYIDPTIVKHAKAQAIVEGISLTTLVGKALVKYLPKQTVINRVEVKLEKYRR